MNSQNLPDKPTTTAISLSDDVAASIEPADQEGYEDHSGQISYIQIRQKELKNSEGIILRGAGGFCLAGEGKKGKLPDYDKLYVTIMREQHSRQMWEQGKDDEPICKSVDMKKGIGNPGVYCLECEYSLWDNEKGEPPKCKTSINLLCLSHDPENEGLFVVTFSPSGIKPWNNFFKHMANHKVPVNDTLTPVPLHFWKMEITTDYVSRGGNNYYVPVFTEIEVIGDMEQITQIKELRTKLNEAMVQTTTSEASVDKGDDDDLPF